MDYEASASRREGLRVPGSNHEPGIADDRRAVAHIGRDARHAAGHGFRQYIGESLAERRAQSRRVEHGVEPADIRAAPQTHEPVTASRRRDGPVQRRAGLVGTRADQDEAGLRRARGEHGGGLDEDGVVLLRVDPGAHADDEVIIAQPQLGTDRGALLASGPKLVGIDAVRDDLPSGRAVSQPLVHDAASLRIAENEIRSRREKRQELQDRAGAARVSAHVHVRAPDPPDQAGRRPPPRESARQCRQQIGVIEPAMHHIRPRGFDCPNEASQTPERAQPTSNSEISDWNPFRFHTRAQCATGLQADHPMRDRPCPVTGDKPGQHGLGPADIERRDDVHHLDGRTGLVNCGGMGHRGIACGDGHATRRPT